MTRLSPLIRMWLSEAPTVLRTHHFIKQFPTFDSDQIYRSINYLHRIGVLERIGHGEYRKGPKA